MRHSCAAGRTVRKFVVLGLLALLLGPPAAAGASGPTLPLGHAGRWITDAGGRIVVLHGVNQVYKVAPYLPQTGGFDDDDAAFLAANGLSAVRVGVIWKAVEPQPGVYDDAYIAGVRSTVDTLARHGVVSLLDFHQDLYNERFQGEGAPDWAVQDDGLPNPQLGFPQNYLANPALERTLDHFFNNDPGPGGIGLQDRYAAAWGHVAAAFRGNPGVLGYEILNEPFPGTLWQPCAVPTGCSVFDAKLTALNVRVDRAIRSSDPRTLIFYEPNVLFNDGADTQLGPLGDPHAALSFHDYCLTQQSLPGGSYTGCAPFDDLVFANALKHVGATGDALLETEWGSTDDAGTLQANVLRADQKMVGWLEWAYTGNDITSSAGGPQALVSDPAKPPTGANVKLAKLQILAQPHPEVVAGTPTSFSFDPPSRTFRFEYTTARAGGGSYGAGSETDSAVPAVEYPSGYAASVSGGALLSAPNAPQLRVAACPGASTIKVSVSPVGESRESCTAASLGLTAGGRGVGRSGRACVDRRRFSFHLHHRRGSRIVRARVRVNGRRVLSRRGRDLRAVSIRRLPLGRFVVQVTTTDSRGRRRTTTRTYLGCVQARPLRGGSGKR